MSEYKKFSKFTSMPLVQNSLKRLIKYKRLISYLSISGTATILDVIVTWILFNIADIDLVISNSIGVGAGFILIFLLTPSKVFNSKSDILSLVIFVATSALGLLIGNFMIVESYEILSILLNEQIAFSLSKLISIVIPFFVMYFLRVVFFKWRK